MKKEMNLTTKQIRKIIKEELIKVLAEGPAAFPGGASGQWYDSPDYDYPASGYKLKQFKSDRVLVFHPNDRYNLTKGSVDTHGRDSHAIKHLYEVDPESVSHFAQSALEWLQGYEDDVYIITQDNPTPQPIEKGQIKLGDIINSFDHINDKVSELGQAPQGVEKLFYQKFLAPLVFKYENLTSKMMNNSYDVSDQSLGSGGKVRLKFILTRYRPIIYVKATFDGDLKDYWLDTKTSDLLSKPQEDQIATFMRIDNKAKGTNKKLSLLQTLQAFRSGTRMQLTDEYSILRELIDDMYQQNQAEIAAEEERKRAAKAAAAAARRAQQTRKPKGNPVEFAKQMFAKGTPKQNIKKAIMGRFKKTSQAADGIMRGAGIP